MKWIKTVIGVVIAISIIPLVVLCVINTKKSLETEKITITTEFLYHLDLGSYFEFEHTTHFDELNEYLEKGFTITNLYDYANDINITITKWNFPHSDYLRIFDNNSVYYDFYGKYGAIYKTYESTYNVNITDMDFMDITLTRTNVNLPAILISFIPLIFVGGVCGVVLYSYKVLKKD